MGWDKGRYYTRSRKENGKVIREYIGKGFLGEAAEIIALQGRAMRLNEADERRQLRQEIQALDAPVDDLDRLANLLVEAAFLAAGFHRHHRGEWRKKRG